MPPILSSSDLASGILTPVAPLSERPRWDSLCTTHELVRDETVPSHLRACASAARRGCDHISKMAEHFSGVQIDRQFQPGRKLHASRVGSDHCGFLDFFT